MPEKKDSELQRFKSLLGHHLQRRATLAPPLTAGDHLDDDVLAAFTEGRLSEVESTPIISHLIDCNFCRHTTANLLQLAAEMGEFEQEAAAPPASEGSRIRQLLESLAARVLPSSDDSAVFAYQARPEELEDAKTDRADLKAEPKRKGQEETQ